MTYIIYNDYLWKSAVFYLFYFGELKSLMGEIRALNISKVKNTRCKHFWTNDTDRASLNISKQFAFYVFVVVHGAKCRRFIYYLRGSWKTTENNDTLRNCP